MPIKKFPFLKKNEEKKYLTCEQCLPVFLSQFNGLPKWLFNNMCGSECFMRILMTSRGPLSINFSAHLMTVIVNGVIKFLYGLWCLADGLKLQA